MQKFNCNNFKTSEFYTKLQDLELQNRSTNIFRPDRQHLESVHSRLQVRTKIRTDRAADQEYEVNEHDRTWVENNYTKTKEGYGGMSIATLSIIPAVASQRAKCAINDAFEYVLLRAFR